MPALPRRRRAGRVDRRSDPVTTLRCSACGAAHERAGQRYCAPCHAAYQRRWRAARRGQVEALAYIALSLLSGTGRDVARETQVTKAAV